MKFILSIMMMIASPVGADQIQTIELLPGVNRLDVGNMYRLPIEINSPSEVRLTYFFPELGEESLAEGKPGLKVFLREVNTLIEVLSDRTKITSESDKVIAEDVFYAGPGRYYLSAWLGYFSGCNFCSSYSSSWPEIEQATVEITLEIEPLSFDEEFPWASSLAEWMDEIGLSERLSLGEIRTSKIRKIDIEELSFSSDMVDGLIVHFNTSFGNRSLGEAKSYSIFDRDTVAAFEQTYFATTNTDLWWRILSKVSLLSELPKEDIALSFDLYCAPDWVRGALQFANRLGETCYMSSSGADLDFKLSESLSNTAAQTDDSHGFTDFRGLVLDRISAIAKPEENGKVEFLTRSSNYVEVIVSGRKGIVIDDGNLWERVQIAASLTETDNQSTVRVFVDGMVASGAGSSPPPNSRFTTSMEPTHAQELNEFSKMFLDMLVNYDE
ncbi:MAG: hypothetical protein AAFR35_14365 [Pseudomonadota bacterium]